MFDFYRDAESFKSANGYTLDGAWFPRVTKIVGIKAKPALLRFYGEAENYKAAQSVSTKSAAEGTLVHEIAQAILLGKTPDIDPTVAPAIEAFKVFLDEKNIQTAEEYIERRIVHHDHRYAGTIDALALIDGKFGVMDIKTSQGIYRDYNLQTAAYMEALKSEFRNLQTRWILRIDQVQTCVRCGATLRTKGGREKIKTMRNGIPACGVGEHGWGEVKGVVELKEFPYWNDDFEAFLAAKKLWEWENEFWLKKIGYV
ncbi:MAG: hypothetical protein HY435_00215 [Candidatus Liptonbacteria bacterium]|nr:hypothetical protein [Candidatus Liptonbacteria bacterium]